MFGRSPFARDDDADRVSEPLFRSPLSAAPAAAGGRTGAPVPPPAHAPSHPPAPTPHARADASILSAAFRLEGDIVGEAELQLDGQVKGDVRAARLVVGAGARVEGFVRAQHVEVSGHVVGSIEAQAVLLYESARVEGDITSGRLSIEGGAHFEGRVQPLRQPARADEAPLPGAPRPRPVEVAAVPAN